MTTRSGLPFLVSASAWSQRVPPRGSTREKLIIWPPLPRRPDLRSSSRQSDWRRVGPERAMEASAGSAGVSPALDFSEEDAAWKAALRGRSSRDLTLGAGTWRGGGVWVWRGGGGERGGRGYAGGWGLGRGGWEGRWHFMR